MNLNKLIKSVLLEASPTEAPTKPDIETPTKPSPAPFTPAEPGKIPHTPPQPGREPNPEAKRSPWVVDRIVNFLAKHGINVTPAE